jgi:hypothetical protein
MTLSIVKDRVAQGVIWLDKNRPGWEHNFRLDIFDFEDERKCVLGQVVGGGQMKFNHILRQVGLTTTESSELGFDCTGHMMDDFQDEWTRVIRERQGVTVIDVPPAPGYPKLYTLTVNGELHGHVTHNVIVSLLDANEGDVYQLSFEEYNA